MISKRTKNKLASLIAALIVMLFGALSAKYPHVLGDFTDISPPGTYKVISIHDGDTISVNMNGNEEKVRLIGIDTPETKDPRKPVQCFGQAASDFTKELIDSSPVRLEADPLSTNRDRYDRLLRYVYLPDNTLVNAEIIRQGYGFAYTSFPFTKSSEFKAYEKNAKAENKGLWSQCDVSTDEKGYKQINPAD